MLDAADLPPPSPLPERGAAERHPPPEPAVQGDQWLRSAIKLAPIGIFVTDAHGNYRDLNERWSLITGLSRAEGLRAGWAQALHPEQRAAAQSRWEQALAQGEEYTDEVQFLHADGRVVIAVVRAAPEYDPNQTVVGFVGTLVDVTKRVAIERALRESEDRYRRLFEGSADAIVLTDDLGNYLEANLAAAKLFGIPRETLLQMNVGQLTVTDGPPSAERFERYRQTGQDQGEFIFIHADGSRRVAEYTAVRLGPNMHQSVLRDVTALRAAQDDLRLSEERFRNAFIHAGIGMALVDLNGRWLQINPALCQIVGYREAEMLRMTFQMITHPDDLEADLEYARQLLTGQIEAYRMDKRYIRKDGSLVWVQLTGSLVRDHNGVPRQFVAQVENISQRRDWEERLRASLTEKEILLKEIHHRVKNNLQVIASLLRLQAEHIEAPAAREMLFDSQRRVRSMALVHERLYQSGDLGRIELGEYIQRLVGDLLRSYRYTTQIDLELAIGVPIAIDTDRAITFGLILNELVSNSIKHAFPNRERGAIRVSVQREAADVVMEIADDGVGMPDGITIATSPSMGLQVVDALTAQLGGTIARLAQPGTVICLRFPERNANHG